MTDEVGNNVRSTEYDAFGNWRAAKGQSNIQMLYQSQQQDPESNLYYLRARYYDPATGRFISRDPVKGYLQDPRTQNGYDYALNNPINLNDPSGEDVIGGCVNVNAGLALYGTCSVCVAYSTEENRFGVLSTMGIGGTTGATASVGVGGLYSNANSLLDLTEQDIFTGGSGGELIEGGGDVSWDRDNPNIKTYNFGVAGGANFSPPFIPAEYHGGTSYTALYW